MGELLLKIKYSMTLDEIGEGFSLFQKKYQFKRNIIYTVVYLIALVLGVDFVIRDNANFYGYLLIGIAAGMTFLTWYKPVMIKRKLLATLSSLSEETYISEIYSDRIVITTVIQQDESADSEEAGEDKSAVSEQAGNSEEKQSEPTEDVTELFFGSDYIDALENDKMFLLFVNRRLIYLYPKRCLTDEEQERIRGLLTEKALL